MVILSLGTADTLAALAKRHRVIAPKPGEAPASLVTQATHIVAEGAAASLACQLALSHAGLVESLVLSAPESADDTLLARLGEIKAPCLLLLGSKAPERLHAAMAAYQQRLPRATRILIYGGERDLATEPAWGRLVTDFIDRGERFVVNPGPQS